jgi:hypothetical protein
MLRIGAIEMAFKIDVHCLLDLTKEAVVAKISGNVKMLLKDLKIHDLILNKDRTKAVRHGVYLFFDNNDVCVYVGKCSSSHFAHRIGAHLAMSSKYNGINKFLNEAIKYFKLGDKKITYNSYVQAVIETEEYKLLIVDASEGITDNNAFISKLEKFFHKLYTPRFNSLRTYKNTPSLSDSFSLREIISTI